MPWPDNTEDYKFTPVFYANDPDAPVLGEVKSLSRPGLVVKNINGRNSVWCSAPLLNADLVRNIAREAGVHVYSENHDLIYANSRYVSITSANEGKTKIHLPGKHKVSDVFTGEMMAENSDFIEYNAKQFETRIFQLD